MRPINTKLSLLFMILLSLCMSRFVNAQDIIILKNGEELDVAIKSIGNDVVQYYERSDSTVTYSLNKSLIDAIEKNAGTLPIKTKPLYDKSQQAKIDIFSFFDLSLSLSYERMVLPYSSLQANVIFYNKNRSKGLEIGADYRIYFNRARLKQTAGYDLLHGTYTFLRLHYGYQKDLFSNFRQSTFTRENGIRKNHLVISGLGLGKQWQYQNFTIDINMSYLYFLGRSREQLESGKPFTVPLTAYTLGIYDGRNNKGVNLNFKIGFQF